MTSHEKNARIFKAFCDPNRLMILSLLRSGEKCACKLQETLGIGQSTLSHHMRILCDAEIVNARRESKWTHYSLNLEGGKTALKLLESILQTDE